MKTKQESNNGKQHGTKIMEPNKGYACVSFVGVDHKRRVKCTVVATTRALQEKWADASEAKLTAHSDGGFKFNMMGWPATVIGLSNGAGAFCGSGLGAHICSVSIVPLAHPHAPC